MEKKWIVIPNFYHKKLKIRATKKETTIEAEIKEILKKEFVLENKGENNVKQ